jgi:hypothetical protein
MSRKNRQNLKIPKIRLIKRQQMWTLTVQGWVIAIALIISFISFAITHIHPFLAVSAPIKADILVIEGWIPDFGIEQALTEFNSGSYRQIVTTGGSVDKGYYLAQYNNFAEITAATFKKLGLEPEKVVAVPVTRVIKDRTYASAAEFEQWLSNSDLKVESINLFSFDTHTRRSWLLYKKILAPKIKVGVIAAKTRDYNPNKWWVSSEGVRTVMSETIAYIYARFLNWQA